MLDNSVFLFFMMFVGLVTSANLFRRSWKAISELRDERRAQRLADGSPRTGERHLGP